MLEASRHVGLFLLNADIFTTPLLISIFSVSYVFASSKHVCLPAVCLFLYFLAQLCLQLFPAERILVLCASAWGALFVDTCVQMRRRRSCVCPAWRGAYVILEDPFVCVCVCVCGRLHHSSCLLTSIHTLMTELHSKPIQAATFRTPPRHSFQTMLLGTAAKIMQWNGGGLKISRATTPGKTECFKCYTPDVGMVKVCSPLQQSKKQSLFCNCNKKSINCSSVLSQFQKAKLLFSLWVCQHHWNTTSSQGTASRDSFIYSPSTYSTHRAPSNKTKEIKNPLPLQCTSQQRNTHPCSYIMNTTLWLTTTKR